MESSFVLHVLISMPNVKAQITKQANGQIREIRPVNFTRCVSNSIFFHPFVVWILSFVILEILFLQSALHFFPSVFMPHLWSRFILLVHTVGKGEYLGDHLVQCRRYLLMVVQVHER